MAAPKRFRHVTGRRSVLETFAMKDAEIERLRKALDRLLHETMYKDHPEASQMAIDALAETKSQGPVL